MSRPQAIPLYLANGILIVGVLGFGWRVSWIIGMFWAEFVLSGFWAFLRIIFATGWKALVNVPLFLFIWGFCSGAYLLLGWVLPMGMEGALAGNPPDFDPFPDRFNLILAGISLVFVFFEQGGAFLRAFRKTNGFAGETRYDAVAGFFRGAAVLHTTGLFGGLATLFLAALTDGHPLTMMPMLTVLVIAKFVFELGNMERSIADHPT